MHDNSPKNREVQTTCLGPGVAGVARVQELQNRRSLNERLAGSLLILTYNTLLRVKPTSAIFYSNLHAFPLGSLLKSSTPVLHHSTTLRTMLPVPMTTYLPTRASRFS
jgi:hypothetical protein